jgi:hypothetical protein
MMNDENDEFRMLELGMAIDAFDNAENDEEAFDVLAFASAGGSREQAIINLCMNATEHSVRSMLVQILLGWLENGFVSETLGTMNTIAQHDYRHMMEELGLPEEDENDENV